MVLKHGQDLPDGTVHECMYVTNVDVSQARLINVGGGDTTDQNRNGDAAGRQTDHR